MYTSYQFYVRACTVAGCSDGPSVTLSTAQMPPTQVKAPTLKVLGQFKVHIYCTAPPLQSFITVLSFVLFCTKEQFDFLQIYIIMFELGSGAWVLSHHLESLFAS